MPSNISSTIEKSGAFIKEVDIKPYREGILSGLTFGAKDLIDTAGDVTGCGNPDWAKSHPPAAGNALCIDMLLAAGGHCVGKTMTEELAFGLIGENFFYGTPLNPKAPDRVPGGSSSGSASAVACGLVDFALGTDTGGSVRIPGSNCGVFGLRPSHGIISVAGIMPFAPTFDTVGIFANSFEVLHKVANVLLSLKENKTPPPKKVYIFKEVFELADKDVAAAAMSELENIADKANIKIAPISIRGIDGEKSDKALINWLNVYNTIQRAEIWASLGSWIESAKPKLGPSIQTNFDHCKALNKAKVPDALSKREQYARKLNELLSDNSLICMPTAPTPAPLKGSIGADRDQDTYYARTLAYTSISGISRIPQITLPLLESNGAPVGLSFLAAFDNDQLLLETIKSIA